MADKDYNVRKLVDVLETVAPTLAAHGLVPIMEHFWFTGKDVMTYDDHMAMRAPCDIGLRMTAPSMLLSMLKVSDLDGAVDFKKRKDEFDFFVGDKKCTLPTLPVKDATDIFDLPVRDPKAELVLGSSLGKLTNALEACLLSVSKDINFPERCGITVTVEDGKLVTYAFNNNSLTRCWLTGGMKSKDQRVTIPTAFWNIFLSLTKGKGPEKKGDITLTVDKDFALATIKDVGGVGDVDLFAKTMLVENPTDLRDIYDKHYTAALEDSLVGITDELVQIVQRASVVSHGDDEAKTEIEVKDNQLLFYTNARRGVADDAMPFKHPDVGPIKIRIGLLEAGLPLFTDIAISKRVVALRKLERVYMISVGG